VGGFIAAYLGNERECFSCRVPTYVIPSFDLGFKASYVELKMFGDFVMNSETGTVGVPIRIDLERIFECFVKNRVINVNNTSVNTDEFIQVEILNALTQVVGDVFFFSIFGGDNDVTRVLSGAHGPFDCLRFSMFHTVESELETVYPLLDVF